MKCWIITFSLLATLMGCQSKPHDMHFGPGPVDENQVLESLEDE